MEDRFLYEGGKYMPRPPRRGRGVARIILVALIALMAALVTVAVIYQSSPAQRPVTAPAAAVSRQQPAQQAGEVAPLADSSAQRMRERRAERERAAEKEAAQVNKPPASSSVAPVAKPEDGSIFMLSGIVGLLGNLFYLVVSIIGMVLVSILLLSIPPQYTVQDSVRMHVGAGKKIVLFIPTLLMWGKRKFGKGGNDDEPPDFGPPLVYGGGGRK